MNCSLHSIRGSALIAALLLSACANDPARVENASLPTERFPIAVEAQMATFRLPLDQRGDLNDSAELSLRQIASDYLQNGSGSLTVAVSGNSAVAAARVTDRLVALGVERNRIMIASDNAPPAAAEARVSFVRYHAEPAPCGDFSESLAITWQNKPSPNFGCATQHNLAVMVADPHDLVAPKNLEAGDAQRSLSILDKFRKGDTTVSTKAQEQSGAISNVATGK